MIFLNFILMMIIVKSFQMVKKQVLLEVKQMEIQIC